ncbi:MAG: polysaccharide deacetylase family protein [Thermodesulfobacteriota bacterium]
MPDKRPKPGEREPGKVEPRAHTKLPVIILTMVIVLGFSLVLFILLLRMWLGPFQLADFMAGRVGPQRINVALLDSGYTASHLFRVGGNYARLMGQWEGLLQKLVEEEKATFRRVTDAELEEGLSRFDVLILPSAVALSKKELAQIQSFTEKGGGTLISWAMGTHLPDGAWRGWGSLNGLAGIEVLAKRLVEEGEPLAIQLIGDSPLTFGIMPGQALTILPRSQPVLALASSFDGYWARLTSGFFEGQAKLTGVEPITIRGASRFAASLSRRAFGRGRVVWFGFGIDSISETYEEWQNFKTLVSNSLAWLAQQPLAAVKSWPGDYQAGAILALDSEENFAGIAVAIDTLRRARAKASFFLLSELAKDNLPLISEAKEVAEIAIHGDTHELFAGQPADIQSDRLSRAKNDLFRLTGREVQGFRPPGLAVDDDTIKAAARLRLDYIFVPWSGTSSPKIIEYPERRPGKVVTLFAPHKLVLFPQPFHDDYSLFFKAGLSPSRALAVWNLELKRATIEGSLFVFSFHTTPPWGVLNGNEHILSEVIANAGSMKMWIAPAGKVARWWLTRQSLAVKTEVISRAKASLTITNGNDFSVDEVQVYFFAPESFQSVNVIVPEEFKGKLISYYAQRQRKLTVLFRELKPGETRWLYIEKKGQP